MKAFERASRIPTGCCRYGTKTTLSVYHVRFTAVKETIIIAANAGLEAVAGQLSPLRPLRLRMPWAAASRWRSLFSHEARLEVEILITEPVSANLP